MDSELISSIEGIDAGGGDGELVRSLSVARDRLEARLCEALVGFFSAGRHDVEGWRSPVGWLKANGSLTDRDARRLAVRADRLRRWPVLARSWFDGEISGAQVEVVVALVPRPLVDLYVDHDAEVSPCLAHLDLVETRAAVREWVPRAEAVTSPDPVAMDDASRSTPGCGCRVPGWAWGARRRPRPADRGSWSRPRARVVDRPDTPGSPHRRERRGPRTWVAWPGSSSITSPRTATAPGAGTPTCSR